jgi:N,N-dimethylformamidase beta subunit-like protein
MHSALAVLAGLAVSSGPHPFAGDGPMLATVSPNGDGLRDAAVVSFRLSRRATVRLEAVRTDTIRVGRSSGEAIWERSWRLAPGAHRLTWRPAHATPPRTYVLRLTVRAGGTTRVYGARRPGSLQDAPVVRVQGVDAGFTERSYAPGESAELEVATDARELRLQVFAYSTTFRTGDQDFKTSGTAMTPAVQVDWRAHRDGSSPLRVLRAGPWPSGLYFLRASAPDGRTGYAPFILRPRRFGTARVAVVLSTNTWQAYNFHDDNGDGWGDSWYVSNKIPSVELNRPYLDFGVPFRFRDWDLTFVAWLNRSGRQVDYLSDDDLERFKSGDELARDYDLVVFPGHAEYVTTHAYDVVERYRDVGGNLMFLSANNFFWRVRREGTHLVRDGLWRDLGRTEAALVGVQYVASDGGVRQAGYTVTDADAWPFAGTGWADGAVFGTYGIEIDARATESPPGTQVLAAAHGAVTADHVAEMTYYETPAGAKVFAAGTLNFAASIDDPQVSRLIENVWGRLSQP